MVTIIAIFPFRIYFHSIINVHYSVDSMPEINSQSVQTVHYMKAEPLQKLSTETLIIGKSKTCKRWFLIRNCQGFVNLSDCTQTFYAHITLKFVKDFEHSSWCASSKLHMRRVDISKNHLKKKQLSGKFMTHNQSFNIYLNLFHGNIIFYNF